jgi:exonuclease-1
LGAKRSDFETFFLLIFNNKNLKVLYKMDVNGCGQLVEAEKLHLSMKMRPEKYSFDKFRHMCILSGCDYLDSLPGIGLKKALKFVTMTAETNPALVSLVTFINTSSNLKFSF